MQKIALLTDSACDLSLDTLKNNEIKLLPLRIIYSNNDFEDKIGISADYIYDNLNNEIPKTSLPSTETIESTLNKLEEDGYTHVIAITLSSGLSGTFNAIRLCLEDHPKLTSFIFDSKILALPEGLVALEVANLIKQSKSFEEIVALLPKIRSNISGYFTLNTLEYLKQGGRIGKVTGTVGELLNLKPIITLNDEGVYYTVCKARGRKQSLSKLTEILKKELKDNKCKVWVLQGGALDEAIQFKETLKNLANIIELGISQISPALGVHTGPGLLGLAIQRIN